MDADGKDYVNAVFSLSQAQVNYFMDFVRETDDNVVEKDAKEYKK